MSSKRTGIKTSHPVYKQIRMSHGLQSSMKRKRTTRAGNRQMSLAAEDENEDSDDVSGDDECEQSEAVKRALSSVEI